MFIVNCPQSKSIGVGESVFGTVRQKERAGWKLLGNGQLAQQTELISGELETKGGSEERD